MKRIKFYIIHLYIHIT